MPSRCFRSFARLIACTLVFAVVASHGPRLAAAGNDADAGAWRMIVMTSPAQILVAPPASTSSADYQAELTALKAAQGRLTRGQQQSIEYWRAGGVVRTDGLVAVRAGDDGGFRSRLRSSVTLALNGTATDLVM